MRLLEMKQDSKEWEEFGFNVSMLLKRMLINEKEWFQEEKIMREAWGWPHEKILSAREKNLARIVAKAYLEYLYRVGLLPIYDLKLEKYDCIIPDDFQASMMNQ